MTSSALTGNTSGLASAVSPGLVGITTQTFAGDKTLTGLTTASGGILNTGLTGANATTAFTAGSGKIGEKIVTNPPSSVAFGGNGVVVNICSQLYQPGIWAIYAVGVAVATVAGTINYWGYGISTVSATIQTSAFQQFPSGTGFVSTTADGFHLVPITIVNLTSSTTIYFVARIGFSSAPTGNYTVTSSLIGTRIA